jgi:hypothetical protein
MIETVVIVVPGLGADTSDNAGFAPRLARDVCGEYGFKGVEVRYYAGPLLRRLSLSRIVRDVVEDATFFLERGYRVRMVGFSNGAEVICRALRAMDLKVGWQVDRVALFGAACDASFNDNGLNRALMLHEVREVVVGVSKADSVLSRWARLSRLLFGWLRLGFGTLGYSGPVEVHPAVRRWVVLVSRDYGHSDWMGAPEVLDAAISERQVFLPKHGDTQRIVLEPEDEDEW